jgi:hypothetical protein
MSALFKIFEFAPLLKRRIVIILLIIIIPLVIVQIWTMNRLSTVGHSLAELDKTKAHLELENKVLKNKIAEKRSLYEAEKKAKNLGYEKISKVEYIADDIGIALNKNP